MMKQGYQSNLKAHRLNFVPGVLIFWGIVFLVMALSIVINITTEASVGLFVSHTVEGVSREVSVVAAAFIAVVIYMVVLGLALLPENFSFLIGLGSSRRAFYTGLITAITLAALANAVIHSAAFGLESLILAQTRLTQLDYLNVYGFQLNLLSLTFVQWFIFTAVGAFFLFVAAVIYRFRSRNALIALVTLAAVSVVLPFSLGISVWGRLFRWVATNASIFQLSGKLLLITLISWGLGWLVVRRMEAR